MKSPASNVLALVAVPCPDWAGVARGVGAAARALARPRRTGRRAPSPAAFTLHELPVDTQPLAARHDRAA